MLLVGLISAISLGLTNVCLDKYVKRNPNSRLARDMDDGCNQRLYHYAVPILSMVLGVSLFFADFMCGVVEDARKDWWFGGKRRWTASWCFGLAAGHYAQEMIFKQWCGVVLFAHHVSAVVTAFCLGMTGSWAGLLCSWGGVYEAGSLLLCLGYTGVVSRYFGHVAVTISTLIGMGFGIHGLIYDWPYSELNVTTWIGIVVLLALGIGRIQEGLVNIREIQQKLRQASMMDKSRQPCTVQSMQYTSHQITKAKRT